MKPRSEEELHEDLEARSGEDAARSCSIPDAQVAGRPPAVPIPLLTPVPISPPFAALELSAGRPDSGPEKPDVAAPPSPTCGDAPASEPTRYTGEALRRAREARGITIGQICDRTRILRSHMENVEADRYERLPAPVYLRGILMAIAKELRLDGQRVARSYLEMAAEAAAPKRKV